MARLRRGPGGRRNSPAACRTWWSPEDGSGRAHARPAAPAGRSLARRPVLARPPARRCRARVAPRSPPRRPWATPAAWAPADPRSARATPKAGTRPRRGPYLTLRGPGLDSENTARYTLRIILHEADPTPGQPHLGRRCLHAYLPVPLPRLRPGLRADPQHAGGGRRAAAALPRVQERGGRAGLQPVLCGDGEEELRV